MCRALRASKYKYAIITKIIEVRTLSFYIYIDEYFMQLSHKFQNDGMFSKEVMQFFHFSTLSGIGYFRFV